MAIRIDWKKSLIMTLVLLAVLYTLSYIIEDRNVYFMVFLGLFVAFMVIGNLLFRRR